RGTAGRDRGGPDRAPGAAAGEPAPDDGGRVRPGLPPPARAAVHHAGGRAVSRSSLLIVARQSWYTANKDSWHGPVFSPTRALIHPSSGGSRRRGDEAEQ